MIKKREAVGDEKTTSDWWVGGRRPSNVEWGEAHCLAIDNDIPTRP